MIDWPEVELGEHVDLLAGFAFKSANFTDEPNEAVRLLRGDNVGQGALRWNAAKHWPAHEYPCFERFHLQEGDVILAMDRPWIEAGLKYAYVRPSDLPCLLVQRVSRMRGLSSLATTFLRYLIGSEAFTGHVKSIITGVNVPHISGRDIKRFRLKLPPLETQQRIASILAAYDDLIEVNRSRVAVLEEMARRVFEEWFIRLGFPGHENMPLEDTPDGPLPKGWQRRRVSEAFTLSRGRSYRSADLAEAGGVPFVNLKCIERDGGFRSSGIKRYVGDYKPAHIVRRGDMVMAVTDMTQERRIVGRTARMPLLDEPEAVISMDLVKVCPAEHVDSAFLYCWLRNSDFGPTAARYANGANVLHLSPNAIADLPISLPPGEVQAEFGRRVEPLFALSEVIALAERGLTASRDLLLPRLLSGLLPIDAAEHELEKAA